MDSVQPRLVAPLALDPTVAVLRAGHTDLHHHVDTVLDRLDAVDPAIGAVVPGTADRARLHSQVDALLARHPDPAHRPPLFGALLGVKDVFDVAGLPTAAGSAIPAQAISGATPATADAAAVAALRAAGALVVAKTVTAEFAYKDSGGTRNPHAPAHTPGGSSHGSAAGVAAGLFPVALGTQTVASTVRPAAYCGVAGFVPSYDRIATTGLVPVARTFDRVGVFAADAAGLLLAVPVLVPGWRDARPRRLPVLAIPHGPFLDAVEPVAWNVFEEQVTALQRAGYEVRRLAAFADADEVAASHFRLTSGEFARAHAALFAEYGHLLGPRNQAAVEEGRATSDEQLARDRAAAAARRTAIEAQRVAAGVDIWITPAGCGPAPAGIAASGPPTMGLPWSYTGLPAVVLPAGTVDGLPLGMQFVGGHHTDEQLLTWATTIAAAL